jgi:hypothetical protein
MPLMKQALPGIGMRSSNCQKSAPDRISALPDELLLHVMYVLTLQEAVQTSLLSRRWKNLWASLMWLNFDAAKFSSMRTYRKFVDNALQYRSSLPMLVPLVAFWISTVCNNSDDSLDYSDIQPWIHHALNSKAWALGILKHSGPKPLSMEGYPFPFTSVYLKILGLSHCFIDDWFVQNLSSCCPVLDDLDLMSCAIHVTMFSSTALKSLAITSTQYRVSVACDRYAKPSLPEPRGDSEKNYSPHACVISENSLNIPVLTLFWTLAGSVQYSQCFFKGHQLDLPRCLTFSKLKQLHLGGWFLSGGCYPLIYLLRRSPNTEKLILQLDTVRYTTPSLPHDGSAYEFEFNNVFVT